MAIKGNLISHDRTISRWYEKLNNALRYTDSSSRIAALTVPAENSRILASNINQLCNTLDAMKTDTYLRTHKYYTDYKRVTSRTMIKAANMEQLAITLDDLAKIKCANNATNTNGMKSDGDKTNGTYDRGTKTNGSESNGTHGDSGLGKGTQSYGSRSNGSYSAGDQSNGSYSNGRRSNGRVIDIYCAQATKTNE